MKKNQTNEQLLRKLISSNSPMENALLRERIIKVMEITIEDMKKTLIHGEKVLLPNH